LKLTAIIETNSQFKIERNALRPYRMMVLLQVKMYGSCLLASLRCSEFEEGVIIFLKRVRAKTYSLNAYVTCPLFSSHFLVRVAYWRVP